MIRKTVHYTGRVQGVGFRYTATTVSKRFAVAGYVQNLPDGRVRLVAEGRPREVEGLIQNVASSMRGYIRSQDVADGEATGEFGDPTDDDAFAVRY